MQQPDRGEPEVDAVRSGLGEPGERPRGHPEHDRETRREREMAERLEREHDRKGDEPGR